MRKAIINLFSEFDRNQAAIASAYGAVAEHFSHIALRDIIDPPGKGYYDAYLARQIAWTILIRDIHIPKRRLVKIQLQSLDTLQRSQRIIEERMECPIFLRAYSRMTARAQELLRAKLEDAV